MEKVIVVYGSTTGNAEKMAEVLGDELGKGNADVVVKNVTDAKVDELKEYDFVFLGSSTWGDGELQDDFLGFEQDMAGVDLSGKKAAVFGCGDSSWALFCEAVVILEKRLNECGAELTAEGFKVDGDVDDEEVNLREWGNKALTA